VSAYAAQRNCCSSSLPNGFLMLAASIRTRASWLSLANVSTYRASVSRSACIASISRNHAHAPWKTMFGRPPVRESNVAARQLYERAGFAVSAVRRRYYRNPEEDALVLWNNDLAPRPSR